MNGITIKLDATAALALVRRELANVNRHLDAAIARCENPAGRKLYLDLDGVMADFDADFPRCFGVDHRDLADEEMWGRINAHPSFFRDLPPCPGAIEFFREVEHLQPMILTACPKHDYANVAGQKRAWVREHLSTDVLVLPTHGGKSKPFFMHAPGDILIDDFDRNCTAWALAGGLAIQHTGDWTVTRAALRQAMAGGE
jgi:5'-nucleotidase